MVWGPRGTGKPVSRRNYVDFGSDLVTKLDYVSQNVFQRFGDLADHPQQHGVLTIRTPNY